MTDAERPPQERYWTPKYWPYWILLGVLRLICLLPHRLRLSVGFFIGRLGHRFVASRRAITRRNIELCFPDLDEEQRNAMALAHFEAVGASVIELGLGRWASDDELRKLTKIEGVEHILEHSDKGVGVLLLGAHFTATEVSGRIMRHLIPPYDVVYRKHRNPFVTRILSVNRERSARRAIEKSDLRGMVRSLRQGVPVWYAPDQSYSGKQSALLPFFGVPAMTNIATTTLAKLGKAVVVPFFPRRLADGSYLVTILPAWENFPGESPSSDGLRYNEMLEGLVEQCPEQYYWIHKKFKNRPDHLPDAYANLAALK